MLELRNVTFEVPAAGGEGAPKRIIDDLSLTIPDDRFTVITGPNGGGKSTLAKLIMGVEVPTSGQILFDGDDITDSCPSPSARSLGIGYGFQQPARFKGMKVKKLLDIAAGKKLPMLACNEYLARRWACARRATSPARWTSSLSGGEVKRIEIATILARDPKLAIYDEPEAGIDLWSFDRLTETFRDIHEARDGRSIVIISHQERIISAGRRDRASARRPAWTGDAARRPAAETRLPPTAWRSLPLANVTSTGGLPTGSLSGPRVSDAATPLMPSTPSAELARSKHPPSRPPHVFSSCKEATHGRGSFPHRREPARRDRQHARHAEGRVQRAQGRASWSSATPSAYIEIATKSDNPGIDITIAPGTKGETVFIPVIVTQAGLKDVVYNTFYIGDDCDVTIVAGCGIHNESHQASEHDGIHTLLLRQEQPREVRGEALRRGRPARASAYSTP